MAKVVDFGFSKQGKKFRGFEGYRILVIYLRQRGFDRRF